jgi:hypothetical protein
MDRYYFSFNVYISKDRGVGGGEEMMNMRGMDLDESFQRCLLCLFIFLFWKLEAIIIISPRPYIAVSQ